MTPYDEARDAALQPVLDAIRAAGPATLVARAEDGPTLPDGRPIPFDPVPRVLTAAQWEPLAAGLVQRARVLEAWVDDVYGERRALQEGVVPPDLLEGVPYVEPASPGRLLDVGFDLARVADGSFVVLEENLLTPGHAAWPAARDLLPTAALVDVPPPDHRAAYREALLAALGDDAAILGDDPPSWELRWLSTFLGLPVQTVATASAPLLWQRTAEDRLQGDLAPLRDAVLRGDVAFLNRPGCGVGDDKRLGARWAELTAFYLDEDPLLAWPETLDLTHDADARARVAAEAGGWVLKPAFGAGGRGVEVGPAPASLERPGASVAQRRVPLSVHPTVVGDALEPRPVDLRVFAVRTPSGWVVPRGGVSRYGAARDAPLVNTSGGGGVKDLWVLD